MVEEFKGSPDYASHMTPLMLACINNDYNMIWLLLDRNHFLPPFGGAEGTGESCDHSAVDCSC